jgi:hypothetical protein
MRGSRATYRCGRGEETAGIKSGIEEGNLQRRNGRRRDLWTEEGEGVGADTRAPAVSGIRKKKKKIPFRFATGPRAGFCPGLDWVPGTAQVGLLAFSSYFFLCFLFILF